MDKYYPKMEKNVNSLPALPAYVSPACRDAGACRVPAYKEIRLALNLARI